MANSLHTKHSFVQIQGLKSKAMLYEESKRKAKEKHKSCQKSVKLSWTLTRSENAALDLYLIYSQLF